MMGRLILRGALLLLAVVVSCVAILVAMPKPHNTYFTGAAVKWNAARQTTSPKVIIVGGSNTAFGLDSQLLGDSLGMPVVNLGLHAGLGMRYMLDEAAQFVGPGDIVVISPEYDQFYGGSMWGRQQLVELAWLHPPSLRLMTAPRQLAAMASGFPPVFQSRLRTMWLDFRSPGRPVGDPVYNGRAFNRHGDVVSHLDVESDRPIDDMVLLRDTTTAFNPDAIRALDDFADFARERDARVFLVYPTVPAYHFDRRRERIAPIHDRLTAAGVVPVLAPPSAHIASGDYFFDTSYHLSRYGRRDRTQQLAALLLRELRAGGPGGHAASTTDPTTEPASE